VLLSDRPAHPAAKNASAIENAQECRVDVPIRSSPITPKS
jgi:hypothetical protein